MPPTNNQNPLPGSVYPATGGPNQSYNSMPPKKHINILLLPLILSLLFLIITISFAFWAYTGRDDYKKNSDKKAATAVAAAEKTLDAKKEAQFVEREKEPLKEYKGPSAFGSLSIKYPKTWSAFVTETVSGSTPVDGYMHPGFVPGLQSGAKFALHFQITNTSYDQEVKNFDSLTKSGAVTATPVTAPKVVNVAGLRLEGKIDSTTQGTVLLFPLRDKTLKITTQSTDYTGDLNNIILPNLTFVP